jgi:multiple sugar transport system substrate-binding protein
MAVLKVALVGGPMYDGLYARLAQFEKNSGVRVEVGFKGDHPALNEHVAAHGAEYDLISTHSKYSPSQSEFLRPLDSLLSKDELTGFEPSTLELMRYRGQLLQLPRVIDAKILFYRKDLFQDPSIQFVFKKQFEREFAPPQTWDELVEIAAFCNQGTGRNGFVFPGKESGLFGHFYEILESAGGELFTADLEPGFVSDAGRYAVSTLVHLYREAAPRELIDWHYDQVATHFQAGNAAMTTDWPGAYHGYQNAPAIKSRFDVAIYPTGPSGKRRVYSGGHSFALTSGTRDVPAALELLRFLTSEESQLDDAKRGSVVPRPAAMKKIREQCEPGSREARRLEILETTMRECMAIPPKFPEYPACEDAIWDSVRGALTGKYDINGALNAAADAVRRAKKEHAHR